MTLAQSAKVAVRREPVLTAATAASLVTAVIAVLVAAGVPISAELGTAIVGLVGVVAPLVTALVARGRVTPVGQHRRET